MRHTILQEADDIKWALEVHAKWAGAYDAFKFAVLEGNEDAPSQIKFWRSSTPGYNDPADYTWVDATTRE